jgi:hypothetical protein
MTESCGAMNFVVNSIARPSKHYATLSINFSESLKGNMGWHSWLFHKRTETQSGFILCLGSIALHSISLHCFFQDFEDRFVVVVGGGRWYCCVAVLVFMNRRFSTISIHIYASIYFSYTIIQEREADRSHHFGWWFVALVPWKHGSFGGL